MSQPSLCPFCSSDNAPTARDCTACGSPLAPQSSPSTATPKTVTPPTDELSQ